MGVIWETFGDFWELWGVLFSMLFFKVHFLGPRVSERTERSDLFGTGPHQGDLS